VPPARLLLDQNFPPKHLIKCLLINPFPESALNDEAGKLFMEDFGEFSDRAKLFTEIYATKVNASNAFLDKEVHNNQ
jgi:ubiquitin-conjugating enzyme E2 S